jgi:hypothetical protein
VEMKKEGGDGERVSKYLKHAGETCKDGHHMLYEDADEA